MLHVPLCHQDKHLLVLLDMEITHCNDPADWMFHMAMRGDSIQMHEVNFAAVMAYSLGKPYVRIHGQVVMVALEVGGFAHEVEGKQAPTQTPSCSPHRDHQRSTDGSHEGMLSDVVGQVHCSFF